MTLQELGDLKILNLYFVEGGLNMNEINQEIHNSGNFINSNGNSNTNTLGVEDNSIYELAIKEITENIQGDDQEYATEIIGLIEEAVKKEKPKKAQRFFDSLPDVAKALPAIVQIGITIASLF